METWNNFIGGELRKPHDDEYLDVIAPAENITYARVASSTRDDVEVAVEAAQTAFPAWSALSAQERAAWLRRISDGIALRVDEFAHAESRDTGKPLAIAKMVDISRAIENFRFFADACTQQQTACFSGHGAGVHYVLKQPRGVAACIAPWNLPLYLLTWKIAPALASGNTVVAKPSELSPATAHLLCTVLQDIQFPRGVLNIVHGTGDAVGEPLVTHPLVRAVSFTGSTRTGRRIASLVAPCNKPLSLEMGGKNSALVFDDVDLTSTISELMRSSLSNNGQICLCTSRILVHRRIYADFREAFVARVRARTVGMPDQKVDHGSLISAVHAVKVMGYIDEAKVQGATVLCGGEAMPDLGPAFVQPTVLEGLGSDARINQEEVFGPVVTLIPFDDENEAIRMANDTAYGLGALVLTRDMDRAHRVAHWLEVGMVWINRWMLRDLRTPFGGVKASGLGREGGQCGLDFYCDIKNVCFEVCGSA